MQRFLSLVELGSEWIALSFDARGAHKLILVDEQEQGFSCFVIKDKWFAYRLCYFGVRWAGYWFARAGGQLVRFLHRFIRLPHGLLLYVDDGLLFLPAACAAHLASSSLMFLVALGVPLSWEKLQHSRRLGWIGRVFDLTCRSAAAPADKVKKAAEKLQLLLVVGKRVKRKEVDRLVGLRLWWTNMAALASRLVPATVQAECK